MIASRKIFVNLKNTKFFSIFKGILFFVFLWVINTSVAFVPFSPQSNTRYVLLAWAVIDVVFVIVLIKYNYFDKLTVISFFIFILLLVLFYQLPLNSNIPDSAADLNFNLSNRYENKYDYSQELFFAVEAKYTSPVRQYLLEPWKVFLIKDFSYFWNLEEGAYADSNIQGRIYRKLLLQSGRFAKEEVTLHQSFCSNSPHLLVKIKHPNRTDIWADFWAVDNFPGVESNETYKFGMRTIRPCNNIVGEPYISDES